MTKKQQKLNELVVNFIKTSNLTNHPIDGPVIKEFALSVAQKLNLNDFKASDGWLNKLKKRNGYVFREISGESAESI